MLKLAVARMVDGTFTPLIALISLQFLLSLLILHFLRVILEGLFVLLQREEVM